MQCVDYSAFTYVIILSCPCITGLDVSISI